MTKRIYNVNVPDIFEYGDTNRTYYSDKNKKDLLLSILESDWWCNWNPHLEYSMASDDDTDIYEIIIDDPCYTDSQKYPTISIGTISVSEVKEEM